MGLLLLRWIVALTVIVQGVFFLEAADLPNLSSKIAGVTAILSGAALIVGLLTPFFALLIVLGGLGFVCSIVALPAKSLLDSKVAAVDLLVMAFVLIFLGPGAYSLDAWFFGRREIVIPKDIDRS